MAPAGQGGCWKRLKSEALQNTQEITSPNRTDDLAGAYITQSRRSGAEIEEGERRGAGRGCVKCAATELKSVHQTDDFVAPQERVVGRSQLFCRLCMCWDKGKGIKGCWDRI